MLQAFMKAVNPDRITKMGDVLTKVTAWEQRLAQLKAEYMEDLSPKIKMGIFVGMLPKEMQDMILQNSAMTADEIPYEKIRDQV